MRVAVYSFASSIAPSQMPSACAAMPIRPPSSVCMAILNPPQRAPVDEPVSPLAGKPRCVAEKQVFGYRNAGHRAVFLHDHADALPERVMHGYGVPRLAEVEHLSAVGRLHSCQNRGYGGNSNRVWG